VRNALFLVGIVVAIGLASGLAFDLSRAGSSAVFIWMGVPTVVLAVLGLVHAQRSGFLKSWFTVRGGDFTRGFAAAAILFGGAYAFMRIVAPPDSPRASWLARLYLQAGDPSDLRKHVGGVVAAIVILSVAEEIVWRGLVISLLEELVGWSRAWIFAAVLFAIAHLPTIWALRDPVAGPNPVLVLAGLGCGLVWGGMYRIYDRLLPSIFSHALFCWAVIMMFRLWGPSV
jgi:membrane protease YdiL (CAAX protease family)